jgi:hypothetical protein
MSQKSTLTTPDSQDRDQRIRTSLAQRSGALEDSLGPTGHAPDAIDAQGLGHCRVSTPDTWAPGPRGRD